MTDISANYVLNRSLSNFQDYLKTKDMALNTIRNYLADLRKFIRWYQKLYNEAFDVNKVSSYTLHAYRDYISNSERLKAVTVNRKIQSLRKYSQFLVDRKIINENPITNIKLLRKPAATQPRALNRYDVQVLLTVASKYKQCAGRRNYTIVQLILQTGLRVSEIINIRWKDITIYERSGSLRVVNSKGHRERVIPLNATARRALLELKNEQAALEKVRQKRGQNELKEDLIAQVNDKHNKNHEPAHEMNKCVFLSKRNEILTVRSIQKMISSLSRMAKMSRIIITPHALRHTFATNYLRNNPGCLVELSELLGHESIDTTSIYTKASKEYLADTLEKSQFMDKDL